MTGDTLSRVQRWYASQCNGDWEHQHGVRIDTLDNPGWQCVIDLADTALEDFAFSEVKRERTDSDWVHCRVRERRFEGFGGACNLEEILGVFLAWAAAHDVLER
jgi:hypothetical protein